MAEADPSAVARAWFGDDALRRCACGARCASDRGGHGDGLASEAEPGGEGRILAESYAQSVGVYALDRASKRPIARLNRFAGAKERGVAGFLLESCPPRALYELAASGSTPIAMDVLERILRLHAVESGIGGRPADDRRAERQARCEPILLALEPG